MYSTRITLIQDVCVRCKFLSCLFASLSFIFRLFFYCIDPLVAVFVVLSFLLLECETSFAVIFTMIIKCKPDLITRPRYLQTYKDAETVAVV